ncbi:MAG: 2-polyprenylphenol 6-hydroxylase [Alphaproteobacteria bacterium RIFCSPHIGHO2_12_FULL_63_12]|nr:MAG: 2-polyprenylphenol 6-hydroxylase [Alphaproteobacteria bacterium RIFCSPHIGHO2_12_FULL_63_12]
MFDALSDFARLIAAGARLSRHDALIPEEVAHHLPAPARAAGALTRLGARKIDASGHRLRPGERLAAAFEGMSPAYVKLGQFMATRPDIIGFDMAADLGRLQDKMPPFPRAEAVAEIERAFQKPLDALFDDFSGPIAAASIAQVHRARLKDGREVAVKVLRPRIETEVTAEFRAFARAARLIEGLSPATKRMEPVRFIETLQAAAALELDLRMEAAAASALKDDLADTPSVRIPEIVWPLTARRVLTLEWIEASPIGDFAALAAKGVDRKVLARTIIEIFLTQALMKGFFHADMHQGNLMIDGAGRLALVDFGIMGRLDEETRRVFAEIIHGFITRDYRRTAKVHFDAGYVPKTQSIDAFAQGLRAVGEPLFGLAADKVDMSRVLQQLFDVTALFDMHLRPELVLLQRTMVTVEGVARALDPEINMWETAAPIVRAAIAEAIGPRRQLEKLRAATQKALDIAPLLPRYVEIIAAASAQAAAGPSAETAPDLARTLERQGRLTRAALWFAGAAGFVLAAALLAGKI